MPERQRRAVTVDVVLDAATAVFAERGFVRARMSEIAKAADVAVGSCYRVGASKEALFAAIFVPREQRAELELPLPNPDLTAMQTLVAERMLAATRLPLHEQALTRDAADDVRAELTALLEERYDAVAASWQLIAAVERTASDLPAVFEAFYATGRAQFLDSLATYLQRRADAGQLRLAAGAPVVARLVVEAIAFWAYHRHQDTTAEYSETDARQVCTQTLLAALLPSSGTTTSRSSSMTSSRTSSAATRARADTTGAK